MTPPERSEAANGSRFAYDAAALRLGDGAVDTLADELAAQDCDRALVVTGRTVGSTPAVMDPVREGLGDRLAGVFAETTSAKRLSTAIEGAVAASDVDADALVAVGGGSSLDVAKAIATIATTDRSADQVAAAFEASGTLAVSERPLPIVAVPTTFAGAEQSQGAGLTATPDHGLVDADVDGGLGAPQLHPVAAVYDPALFATTPRHVLAGSAMNGVDKGIETLYSRHATPVTDATAARGLSRFRDGLLALDFEAGADAGDRDGLAADPDDSRADGGDGLAAAVEGLLLVQYGISRTDATTLGPIHAFGQALSAVGVHQGTAHAIVAPYVLSALFEVCDGRRALLARALSDGSIDPAPARGADPAGVDAADPTTDPATVAVEGLTELRDALDVPTRLREVDAVDRDDLSTIAADVASHRFLENGPTTWTPGADECLAVLEAAW